MMTYEKLTKRIVSVAVLFFALTGARAAFVNPDAERLFVVLSGAFQSGKYESSIAESRNFLNQFPRHSKAAAAQYIKAESYFLQKRWPEAAAEFKEFMANHRASENANLVISARFRIGECHLNLKKYLTALDHFSWVEKSKNNVLRAEALLGSAYCYLGRGENMKAEGSFVKLLESHSGYANMPRVIVPLALIYMERGDYKSASTLLERAPDDPAALFYRGVCQRLLNRVIAASQLLKEVLDNDPAHLWTDKGLYQMGEAYFQSKEFPLAYNSFRRIYKSELASPLRPFALFRMGCVDFQNGNFEQAGLNWAQLVKEFPQNLSGPASQYLLAEISLRQGELAKAIPGFSALVTNNDYSMDAQFKIIWSLAVQGQYDIAITKADHFIKDFEWGELHAKVSLIKGLCQMLMKKPDDAVVTFQFILDRYPNTAYFDKALYLMAVTMVQERRYAEVVTHVYTFLKRAPATPTPWQAETYYWVAEAYYNIEQFELARQTYELVTKNYRASPLVPGAMLGMAASLSRLGRYDEASDMQARARELAAEGGSADTKMAGLLDSADVFFNKREYERAASFYEEFIAKYPDDSRTERALYQAGLALYRQEYFTEAIAKWTTLTNKFKNSRYAPDGLFQTARTYFGLGQYNPAYQSFRKLTELYPDSPLAKESMLQMGQCFYNAGDIPRAIDQYTAYMKKYPNDEKANEVQELLQMAYYKQGKTAGDMKDLVAQFPKSKFTADIYWELGAEAYNRKEYDRALDYFERLILDFPESTQAMQAFYYKADSYFLKGDFAAAVNTFKNFIANYPQEALTKDSRFKLAVCFFSLKDYGQAAIAFNDFQEAHPSDPKSKDAAMNIPVCYTKAGQPFQAIDAYGNFLRRFPDDDKTAYIYMQIGQLYEDAEDFVKAVETYKKIQTDEMEIFEATFNLGRCYEKLKAPSEQMKAYETLRRLSPKDNKFRLAGLALLGEMYEKEKATANAIAIYSDIASFSTNAEWRSIAQQKVKELKGGK
ncbi:MAG: tetratricopeptide repeat protein [Elusimicrobia bacterium]|nr:tetratricopeptide repeat protein [Elusimicrobiota bacterium]